MDQHQLDRIERKVDLLVRMGWYIIDAIGKIAAGMGDAAQIGAVAEHIRAKTAELKDAVEAAKTP